MPRGVLLTYFNGQHLGKVTVHLPAYFEMFVLNTSFIDLSPEHGEAFFLGAQKSGVDGRIREITSIHSHEVRCQTLWHTLEKKADKAPEENRCKISHATGYYHEPFVQ